MGCNIKAPDLKIIIKEIADQVRLQSAPCDGYWVLPVPACLDHKWVRKATAADKRYLERWGTSHFAFRTPKVIPLDVLCSGEVLIEQTLRGDGASHNGLKAYMHNDRSRNDFNAIHSGQINHYLGDGGLHLTSDITQQKEDDQKDALKRLMLLMRDKIAPIIIHYLRWFDPLVYQFQLRCVISLRISDESDRN